MDDNLTPWHVLECVALANVWCCSDERDKFKDLLSNEK